MDLCEVRHIISHGVHRADVTDAHSKVLPDDSVHENVVVSGVCSLVGQSDADRLLSLLAYQSRNCKLDVWEFG